MIASIAAVSIAAVSIAAVSIAAVSIAAVSIPAVSIGYDCILERGNGFKYFSVFTNPNVNWCVY